MDTNRLSIYYGSEKTNTSNSKEKKVCRRDGIKSKQKKHKNTRELTVYYQSHYTVGKIYSQAPKIILQGQWLEELGFSVGEKVDVTCEVGRIVIKKASVITDAQENKEIGMVAEPDNPYGRG